MGAAMENASSLASSLNFFWKGATGLPSFTVTTAARATSPSPLRKLSERSVLPDR